ncbi:aminoglycoside phosphotransferase family protein [Nonomuraea sp. SYSU D8015]|uniref:aminoglycoside phosphotransferase family protein n=1 Tax=Nonomuraea sp. SYSU D8015 TaxID=2593644 RepID=UPI001CB72BD5|nr:aminoglycoside phosphotransferase family protein [Nonomuraea sp. SYSU D8015]
MAKMHAGEVDTDESLVRRLLAAQFPQWAHLPVTRFPSPGTVNAVYRLGDDLCARLPLIESGVGDVEKEQRWLPLLAPLLPVAIPEVLGAGVPGEGYPWPWTVCRWLPGANPEAGAEAGPLAADLAAFVAAFRRAGLPGGPRAYRAGPLARVERATRHALGELDGVIDTAAAAAVWDAAVRTPEWQGPPVWVHSDLMPGNLLVEDGRLTGVIDFGTAGVGDPASDLIAAWNLLPPDDRKIFRAALDPDDDTWARGRGWALSMALTQLAYYQHTNPAMAANARHTIQAVITECG